MNQMRPIVASYHLRFYYRYHIIELFELRKSPGVISRITIYITTLTDRLDSSPTYFRYYKTDFVSFHLEVRHCGAIRIGEILV